MKCPKCGYTSFESYDSCRKCSTDLVEFKQSHGLTPMILPPSLQAELAAGLGLEPSQNDASADTSSDMFTFNLPTDQQPATTTNSSPFSFDDTPTDASAISFDTPAATRPDPFASLLTTPPQPAAAPQQAPPQGFEMNSFSWDDTPTPGEAGTSTADDAKKTDDDDFNSLFGDLDGSDKK